MRSFNSRLSYSDRDDSNWLRSFSGIIQVWNTSKHENCSIVLLSCADIDESNLIISFRYSSITHILNCVTMIEKSFLITAMIKLNNTRNSNELYY